MIKHLLIFILLFVNFTCIAQNSFELSGRVIAQTRDTLEVSVLNLSRETGVVTNEKGDFKIDVSIGENLYFSSIQFEPLEVEVTSTILEDPNYMVFLFPKINELQEVLLSSVDLIGIEEADIKNIPLQPYLSAANLGLPQATKPLPTIEERRIYTASSGPLDLLINTLNGELKKLRKLNEWAKLDRLVVQGEQAMAVHYFEEYCGVPEAYISDFIYFCAQDDRYKPLLKQQDKLKLFEFFEEKGPAYKEFRQW
ncbi:MULTISPECIES: hypothetical protein [Croceibacter]|jgi:hypothetical protein|uniref:hypothetical protein n=1 Tax=Croceibacter TaxID=216431 RepID=UPI000C5EDC6A|nr:MULTISPECIES: hypothetical protein [Croceibacter]MBG26903.1 hypothetical protein [Croceibacter sp.]|tara:strand:+ start:434 stop:1192 length:759 start_codon:yes stop_codon:yes gene_type:complete